MARRKTITREHIARASYDLVVNQGFSHFTARNIAKAMGCSTQPIYLEFENMGELRGVVEQALHEDLTAKLQRRYTDDPVIDLGLAYINFAQDSPALFRAAFIHDHLDIENMPKRVRDEMMARLKGYEPVKGLTAAQLTQLVTGLWIVATGMANLAGTGFIELTQAQVIDTLKAVIHDFVGNGQLAASMATIQLLDTPKDA